jgi:NADPH-dependent curcumin reductase CurA
MSERVNRQWRVARYLEPGEMPGEDQFEWVQGEVPEPGEEEFLVQVACLAPGPAQRGYLLPGRGDFLPLVKPGEVMRGRGVGRIVASRHADYPVGEVFLGSLGWQDYSIQRPRGAEFVFSTALIPDPAEPLSLELGMLGQAGATAYFGLFEAAGLVPGDTVLVSAAAGGVGSMVGQIARIHGAKRVVGIAGGAEKCAWLTNTLGFDTAIDYRDDNLEIRLAEEFPDGIDVFFDCVGGDTLDTALTHLAMHARVAICGYISTQYLADSAPGPHNYNYLLRRRARMQGFVVFDYWERFPAAREKLFAWHKAGQLHNCQDEEQGLEKMPDCLASLFTGANRGIKLCRVAPD